MNDRGWLLEKLKSIDSLPLPYQFEFRSFRKDGAIIHLRAFVACERDPDGRTLVIYGACQDISDERRAAATVKEQQIKLIAAAKLSSLGEMAGGIAHEINNPLTIIAGKARQLRSKFAGNAPITEINNDLELIESTVFRIAKIVKGLRSFARDGSNDPAVLTAVALILDDTFALCHERLKNQGVQLIYMPSSLDVKVTVRPIQITQVLINLINNAFDAVEHLEQINRWIRIETQVSESMLSISVSNGGPKIDADVAKNIMKPFFTTKPPGKGTGLGLAISRGIVVEHGGHLSLDRQAEHTTFVIHLAIDQEQRNGDRQSA